MRRLLRAGRQRDFWTWRAGFRTVVAEFFNKHSLTESVILEMLFAVKDYHW